MKNKIQSTANIYNTLKLVLKRNYTLFKDLYIYHIYLIYNISVFCSNNSLYCYIKKYS